MKPLYLALLAMALAATPSGAGAHDNQVSISKVDGKICIRSNGLPNHSTGRFPNRGNPNSIRAQRIRYCFTQRPAKGSKPRWHRGSIGVALNGVTIRPGTADYWDPRAKHGFSRNGSSGWNLEGVGASRQLGMDNNNAHVDERGLYHYHGVPNGLLNTVSGSLIGYAADGFEIRYLGNRVKSGWTLKQGNRPDGPGGRYDGTYNQDWEYTGGAGRLDVCNGGTLNGKYVYFATTTYPFYPRCLWGKPSRDFRP